MLNAGPFCDIYSAYVGSTIHFFLSYACEVMVIYQKTTTHCIIIIISHENKWPLAMIFEK